jgi:hypothetical protein
MEATLQQRHGPGNVTRTMPMHQRCSLSGTCKLRRCRGSLSHMGPLLSRPYALLLNSCTCTWRLRMRTNTHADVALMVLVGVQLLTQTSEAASQG